MAYEVKVEKTTKSKIDSVDFENIQFGRIFSDHMLVADYYDGQWNDIKIMPYQKLSLAPSTAALHYGQEIFEGMKAFRHDNGEAYIFRPKENWIRMKHSAYRMCMPEVPEDLFIEGTKQLVALDKDWIPSQKGSSLYIRPFMFATDELVGIKPSDTYKFMIITCPVNAYYAEPIKVRVEEHYSRAARGGTGSVKTAGNYGLSLLPAKIAQNKGYKQLLWTDSAEHKYFEESGTMNIFFVIGETVVTPPTDGTILEGVTRDSVIVLLRDKGYIVEERDISVDEILEAYREGMLKEVFGTGTAAVIAQIIGIGYQDEDLELPDISSARISNYLMQTLDDIRKGHAPDKYSWLVKV